MWQVCGIAIQRTLLNVQCLAAGIRTPFGLRQRLQERLHVSVRPSFSPNKQSPCILRFDVGPAPTATDSARQRKLVSNVEIEGRKKTERSSQPDLRDTSYDTNKHCATNAS